MIRATARSTHERAFVAVKVIHTVAWFSIESCMRYLLYAGFMKRTDRRVAVAAAVVGGESVIFAANGFRSARRDLCPVDTVTFDLPRCVARHASCW